MPDPAPAHADTAHVQRAISILAPRWTSWTLQILQERGSMRFHQLTEELPWLEGPNIGQILMRMQASGLVQRPGMGVYEISPLGHSAQYAQRALASWHTDHVPSTRPMARAQRTEHALSMLRGKGTVDVLTALSHHGHLRPGELREATGLASGSFHYRTQQLTVDQLVTRLGRDFSFAYTLTPAAKALTPVYAELDAVGRRARAADRAPGHGTLRMATIRQVVETDRARAAVRRSPSALPGLFSHPPEPQPSVPAHITALSHPARTR